MSMATYNQNQTTGIMAKLNTRTLVTAVTAGAFATVAFDLFGATISPLLGGIVPTLGAKLAPIPLANSSLAVLTGLEAKFISAKGIGHGVHVLTGLLAYPLGYIMAAKPIGEGMFRLPWYLNAVAYGVVLWAFALYVMAHLVAGLPAFLGFSGITWVALWGHILFAFVIAAIVRARDS